MIEQNDNAEELKIEDYSNSQVEDKNNDTQEFDGLSNPQIMNTEENDQ